jgi:hypothetical protein
LGSGFLVTPEQAYPISVKKVELSGRPMLYYVSEACREGNSGSLIVCTSGTLL